MRDYTESELAHGLAEVGVEAGDHVMVHASLAALGVPRDIPRNELAGRVAAVLQSAVGPGGTIVVPTFNFGFCRGALFDRQETPAQGMGPLAEHVRALPDSVRSSNPMQSLAAVGSRATAICSSDAPSAFHPDGSFAQLLKEGGKLLLIGATFNAASILHLSEEKANVPYRYWKTFCGPYRDGGPTEQRCYRMFVRNLDLSPTLHMQPVEDALKERGQLRTIRVGAGRLRSCLMTDAVSAADQCLSNDPLSLLSNRVEVERKLAANSDAP